MEEVLLWSIYLAIKMKRSINFEQFCIVHCVQYITSSSSSFTTVILSANGSTSLYLLAGDMDMERLYFLVGVFFALNEPQAGKTPI